MSKTKIITGCVVLVVLVSIALGTGVMAFNNTDSKVLSKKDTATLKSVNASKVFKTVNSTDKLSNTASLEKAYDEAKKNPVVVKKKKKKKKKQEVTYDIEINDENTENTKTKKENNGYKYLGQFRCTAYCGCAACCGAGGGTTASGTTPKEGRTIATDPSVIPLGSKVKINGHVYTAEDTGGAVQGNVIDVFFAEHDECFVWGVRTLDVYIKK